MSNPITAGSSLALSLAGVNVSVSQQNISLPQSGSKYLEILMSVPTTAGGTAIPVSSLATLGLCSIQNLDPTNYVTLLNAASGTVLIRMLPGDPPFLFRFDTTVTAPALLSHTGACICQILILEI